MILVTGGAGFIGTALVKTLVKAGEDVRVFDNCSRSNWGHLSDVPCEKFPGDVRNPQDLMEATLGVDEVIHLAYINGTKTFYEKPYEVLDVGVRGMLNLLNACKWRGIKRMMLASSSEVCRMPVNGMDEAIPLVIPDPYNPRYSYSAGKIMSEILALHCGLFDWLVIFRPFNIYGPGMSQGHVIPDFKMQVEAGIKYYGSMNPLPFKIQGSGDETRSFCYIDDFIDGLMLLREKGKHKEIYNIGTPVETTIRSLALRIGKVYERDLRIIEGNKLPEGSIQRRKPEITKLVVLGYQPKVSLDDGLRRALCR